MKESISSPQSLWPLLLVHHGTGLNSNNALHLIRRAFVPTAQSMAGWGASPLLDLIDTVIYTV